MGGTSTRQGMRSSLRSLPHTHGGALKCLSEEENSPHRWGTGAFSPCLFSMLGGSLHRWGPLTGSPEPKASGCLPYTHVGNHITAFHQEYCERSSPHACGRWETGCRGKNRGKKRKTQYCLPYTRRENQLWQPVCPFLRFLPYTYGEAPTLMTRPSPAMSSSLRVTGESPRRPATPEPEAGLPYITGEFPQPSRSPMLLTPPFGRPEASPYAPRARQCCVPVWTPFMQEGLSRPVFCFIPCKRQRCAIVLAPPDAVLQRSTHD